MGAFEAGRKLLQDQARYNPVVVSSGKKGTLVNPEEPADRLGNEVGVYVLASSTIAFDFR